MSETRTVVLPDGFEISEVPMDMTKDQLFERLSESDRYDAQTLNSWRNLDPKTNQPINNSVGAPETPVGAPETPMAPEQGGIVSNLFGEYAPALRTTGNAIANNLDIPGGISGSIAGAKLFAPLGPAGFIGGGIVGGALGTGVGSAMSDFFMEDDVDYGQAGKEMLISAGIDAATLGLATRFKTLGKIMGYKAEDLATLWGKLEPSEAFSVGDPDSLIQTQKILEEAGGSLTAFQTGKAGTFRLFAQNISELGVISGSAATKIAEKNSNILADNFQTMINNALEGVVDTTESIGSSILGVVEAGKDAASKIYGKGLDEVAVAAGKKLVPVTPIMEVLSNFRAKGIVDYGNNLNSDTLKVITNWEKALQNLPTMDVRSLLAMEKQLKDEIQQLAQFGTGQNKKAAEQLYTLSASIRQVSEKLFENVDPAISAKYRKLNTEYGEAMQGLVPPLNASTVARANKGDYDAISRALKGKNPNVIEEFMKSIDVAYQQATLAGIDMSDNLGLATAKQAKGVVRAGFLKNIFGEITPQNFDSKSFANLAKHYEIPTNRRAAMAILGDDYPRFKALLNAAAESTATKTGGFGSLVLRSKEAGVLSGSVQIGTALAGSVIGSAFILGGPVLLGKIVRNPDSLKALLLQEKKISAMSKIKQMDPVRAQLINKAVTTGFEAVMDTFSPADAAEIRESMRKAAMAPMPMNPAFYNGGP